MMDVVNFEEGTGDLMCISGVSGINEHSGATRLFLQRALTDQRRCELPQAVLQTGLLLQFVLSWPGAGVETVWTR